MAHQVNEHWYVDPVASFLQFLLSNGPSGELAVNSLGLVVTTTDLHPKSSQVHVFQAPSLITFGFCCSPLTASAVLFFSSQKPHLYLYEMIIKYHRICLWLFFTIHIVYVLPFLGVWVCLCISTAA